MNSLIHPHLPFSKTILKPLFEREGPGRVAIAIEVL